jgi:hypothetical protein
MQNAQMLNANAAIAAVNAMISAEEMKITGHVYPVYRVSYGDFDVPQHNLVSVYESLSAAHDLADTLNSHRTELDHRSEIEYVVGQRVGLNQYTRREKPH